MATKLTQPTDRETALRQMGEDLSERLAADRTGENAASRMIACWPSTAGGPPVSVGRYNDLSPASPPVAMRGGWSAGRKGVGTCDKEEKCLTEVMSEKELLSRITIDPEICHGKPCIRGLRYPVVSMLEYLAGGDTSEDLLREFPDLEPEDIQACLTFAARSLNLHSVHLAVA